jgi:lipoprotein-releasing system permease protein
VSGRQQAWLPSRKKCPPRLFNDLVQHHDRLNTMNPWLPFEWIAATRFLREGWMQTLLTISGIAIGVSVIIFMSTLMTGLQSNFVSELLASQPQIQLVLSDEIARPLRAAPGVVEAATVQQPAQRPRSIDQWQTVQLLLRGRPDVATVSPTVSASALAVRGDASRSISVTGIEPDDYFRIVKLRDRIVLGKPDLTNSDIIIGNKLATDLSVTIGDKINVTAANGVVRVLTVTAIFDLGSRGANSRATYVALRTAQTLANLSGGVSTIDVNLKDAYAAETIAQEVQAATGVQADSWIKTNANFFEILRTQNISFGSIQFFVGLSVAFGMASVLVNSVIQRSKDIGILRAMGTSRRQILRLFLLQGGILALLGSVAGSLLAGVLIVLFRTLMRRPDGTQLFPLLLESQLIVYVMLGATLAGVAAAAVPALQAARLDPVVAIRG